MSLVLSHVDAGYGRTRVLHDVSLELATGSTGVVLGANGAGKTTLLRAISGTNDVAAGHISANGRRLSGVAPSQIARSGVAHVPQGRGTFPDLTVEENLRLGALSYRSAELAASMERWFTFFPILADRRLQVAGNLSGGEQQMLAIARALMMNPNLLLLDEPSLGLAPRITAEIFALLEDIKSEIGVTTLLVEQNANAALAVADAAFLLEAGRVVLAGEPDDIRRDPAMVAAYLGH